MEFSDDGGGHGDPQSAIPRVWQALGIQSHPPRTFTLSTDPFFMEKVRGIVGLYLNPPDKALVLCVDETMQVQVLNRTQPVLPLGLGYVEGVTHDYVRRGTTTLFAARNVGTGTVITQCRRRHRHQEFPAFLRHIEANVPRELAVHFIVDNYATHKHPKVRLWLASRPRYHVHYTPTYASWLNQVKLWFRRISQQAIRRGSFLSVKDLVAKPEHWRAHVQHQCQAFCVDGDDRFDPRRGTPTLRTYFRDAALDGLVPRLVS